MGRIRVLVADDDPGVRKVLSELIATDASMELVGVATDAAEAESVAATAQPDVALLDVKMPGGGGPAAARRIRERHPRVHFVALSAHEDDRSVQEMLAEGVSGYLVKGASPREVLTAIREAAQGRATLSGPVATRVVRELGGRLEREREEERERTEWRERISRVLAEPRQIALAYQPIVSLADGRLVGLEALSRFRSEPVAPPDVWFGRAWELGLGADLEIAALGAALRSLDAIPAGVYLSINLSPNTLAKGSVRRVLTSSFEGARVVLEVTETAPIDDYAEVRAALDEVKARGLRLAVDDAGAGYASLRHILELGPDLIKLDLTLTRNIDVEKAQQALASALTSFARGIGAELVAEGVETQAELETLRDLRVGFAQGYYFGRPAPLEEILRSEAS